MTRDEALNALAVEIVRWYDPDPVQMGADITAFLRDNPDVRQALLGPDLRPCARSQPHPAHLHMFARTAYQCPGLFVLEDTP